MLCCMRTWSLQLLTWGTIVTAVASALWLAAAAPLHGHGASAHADASIELIDFSITDEAPPAAGATAASAPMAGQASTAL